MTTHGFVRVACAVPEVRLAACSVNADRILELMRRAQSEQVDVLVFPELCLTGYTCGDLFHQPVLQRAACAALDPPGRAKRFSLQGAGGCRSAAGDSRSALQLCGHPPGRQGAGHRSQDLPAQLPRILRGPLVRSWHPQSGVRSQESGVRNRQCSLRTKLALRRQPGLSRSRGRRGNLRGSVGARSAEFAASPGRGHAAAQSLGQQRGHRQTGLSSGTRGQSIRPLSGGIRLCCSGVGGIDHRSHFRRTLPGGRERLDPGRVRALSARPDVCWSTDVDIQRAAERTAADDQFRPVPGGFVKAASFDRHRRSWLLRQRVPAHTVCLAGSG